MLYISFLRIVKKWKTQKEKIQKKKRRTRKRMINRIHTINNRKVNKERNTENYKHNK